jgi:hypothetical protein
VPRNDAARSGRRSVCCARSDDACAFLIERGWVTAGAELLRLNRPSSTSPGGKRAMWPLLDVARGSWYASSWTRATRVARRFRFALTISPSPCRASAGATPAFPARARWKMAPAPGRPPPAWRGCEWRNRRCLPGPAPSRATPQAGTCTQRGSHPVRTLPAAQGRQHWHARAGPVGS